MCPYSPTRVYPYSPTHSLALSRPPLTHSLTLSPPLSANKGGPKLCHALRNALMLWAAGTKHPHQTLNTQHSTLDTQHSTLNPRTQNLEPKPQTPNPEAHTLPAGAVTQQKTAPGRVADSSRPSVLRSSNIERLRYRLKENDFPISPFSGFFKGCKGHKTHRFENGGTNQVGNTGKREVVFGQPLPQTL